jgi:hypothetical protein
VSEEEEVIIIATSKRQQAAATMSETQESIYDVARAVIDAAELNNTPIVFQYGDENPVD